MTAMRDAQTGAGSSHLRPVPDEALFKRFFTKPGEDPFDTVEWEFRDVQAGTFSMENVEVPKSWTDQSIGIVAKLYFATVDNVRENSVRTMILRVVSKLSTEMRQLGYFSKKGAFHTFNDEQLQAFSDELKYALLHQYVTFNSPVWFNLGVPGRKQVSSACFLLSVEDHMIGPDSITDWWTKESLIFKGGAGSGINLSKIRGSMEPLSTGGIASGPVAYMRPADAGAGTLKSGGAHRRAAKLVRLDADHPDILDFIDSKVREDVRMRALAAAGVNMDPSTPDGERNIAESTSFQNANVSVGVTDEFMELASGDRVGADPLDWPLVARKSGDEIERVSAQELLHDMAQAAWTCADPGLQFHDTIQRWHTTPSLGEISTSNPCLVGSTLVDTAEGRIPISHLAAKYSIGERLPMVFAWDIESSLPVLRQIRRAFVTKMVDEIVVVRTTKGVTIRCTPDHPILTREGGRGPDGPYVLASELKPGDRLRKVARWVNEQRSDRRYINHRETERVANGTVSQARFMWEQAYGPIPDGMEVHHINENPTDDRLSNFELVDEGLHQAYHSGGERNGRFIESDVETLIEVYERALEVSRFGRVGYGNWARAVEDLGLVGQVTRANAKGIRGMKWSEFIDWIEGQRSAVNDSVASVEVFRPSDPIPVYDLEVEGTHNFAVASEGVEHTIIVHNCGETYLNDNSACNLASLNILRYLSDGGDFDITAFLFHVDLMISAMDATCSFSDLPTPEIEKNTRELRQLGLGYSNLGAAIMAQGLPYDSDEGRAFAAAVSSLMTSSAYIRSSQLAEHLGAFEHFMDNRETMLGVIDQHMAAAIDMSHRQMHRMVHTAVDLWQIAAERGRRWGFRNSQVTLVQPGGTTSFMMGCDTTGVEPAFGLVTTKRLASGGQMTIVNGIVERALYVLGYDDTVIQKINEHLNDGHAIEEYLRPEHRPVFATAIGENTIAPLGHVKMVAAVQPFLSQGVSKTVNLPNSATVEDIVDVFVEAWSLGLKGISLYRDGSKATQVLSAPSKKVESAVTADEQRHLTDEEIVADMKLASYLSTPEEARTAMAMPDMSDNRRRMPREREAKVVKFSIDGHEGYMTCGMHPDGTLGEIFFNGVGKDGSTLRGILDAFATDFSIGLQYGVPLETFVRKHAHVSFPPSGMTTDPEVPTASSIVDYVARKLAALFLDVDICEELGVLTSEVKARKSAALDVEWVADQDDASDHTFIMPVLKSATAVVVAELTGTPCRECGGNMRRTGTCHTCDSCGASTGCG